MNIIKKLFGFNKYTNVQNNAANLIQNKYRKYHKQQKNDYNELLNSINRTFHSEFTIITQSNNGQPIIYKECLETDIIDYDEDFKNEMKYYLKERRRIKGKHNS